MPQSLAQIYLHIIFSTKHRRPLIGSDVKEELYKYIGGICKDLECHPIQVGGYYDHVHILCNLSKKIAVMKLLEEVKKGSSKWIKTKGGDYEGFYWQDGYGAFSVSYSELNTVKEYICNQYEHHTNQTFQEESRILFKKYNVDYDEKYIWD
jgi:REP element-mobilizing transposase RayT